MTASRIPGDEVRVTVTVAVPPEAAFRLFTEHIDRWWRRGLKFRAIGGSALRLEPRLGGQLLEVVETEAGEQTIRAGTVTRWAPPDGLGFDWRAANFAPNEITHVDVRFEAVPRGTQVTVRHSGWARLRAEHPVRHGQPPATFIRARARWWGDLMTSFRMVAAGDG